MRAKRWAWAVVALWALAPRVARTDGEAVTSLDVQLSPVTDEVTGTEITECAAAYDTLRSMFGAFERRSADGYVAAMDAEYTFTPVDADGLPAGPARSRLDEQGFATTLFRGGIAANGAALPAATAVHVSHGDVAYDWARGLVRVTLRDLSLALTLDTGATLDIGGGRTQFVVRTTPAGWRVLAWSEQQLPDAAPLVTADLLPPAPPTEGAPVRAVHDTTAAAAAAVPPRLALVAWSNRSARALVFDCVAVQAGARLELFDVAGRRLVRRDVDAAPRQRVTLDAGALQPGVYFARLSDRVTAATAKVIWLR